MFLLDTNIVSELIKRAPDAKVLARLNREPPDQLLISSATVFELRFGAARSVKPASLWGRIQRDITNRFEMLPFTERDALAGVAFQRNLTFVTRKRRDFDRVTGLQVENWFE